MFANFGPGHWAVLAVVVILLFGAKKLPDAARSLGASLRIFKSEMGELQNDAKPVQPEIPPTPVQVEPANTPAAAPEAHADTRST
jgi:sec-independent protein translocase protein TatA